jgi:hypothetical protein
MQAERIAPNDARYDGHGDLELTKAERDLLRSQGFEPWGNHAWVLFAEDGSEQGGTCYDDRWAMREALWIAGGRS